MVVRHLEISILETWEWLENDTILRDQKTLISYDGGRGNRDLTFE